MIAVAYSCKKVSVLFDTGGPSRHQIPVMEEYIGERYTLVQIL